MFKEDRVERVMKKLLDYGVIKNPDPQIEKLIELAGNFADEFDQQEKVEIDMDESAKKVLRLLADALSAEKEPEDIQNTIYQIAKSNGMEPKDFFKILYQIILGTSRGPKIGPLITDIGRKKVAKIVSEYI
jgi:lysyl-tRNA synthetase class 1